MHEMLTESERERRTDRERKLPIKDERKKRKPKSVLALFINRKNQIIKPHKNTKQNAVSLTTLRILQTKDNNIMSRRAN